MLIKATEEEFIKLFEMAEKGIAQGCAGATMTLDEFKYTRNLTSYQVAYYYNRELRDMALEDKTVYLGYHKFHDKVVLTFVLVPDGYEAPLGSTGWRQKKWLEFDQNGNSKITIY